MSDGHVLVARLDEADREQREVDAAQAHRRERDEQPADGADGDADGRVRPPRQAVVEREPRARVGPAPTKASVANEYRPAVPSTSDHIRLIEK